MIFNAGHRTVIPRTRRRWHKPVTIEGYSYWDDELEQEVEVEPYTTDGWWEETKFLEVPLDDVPPMKSGDGVTFSFTFDVS